MKLAKTIKKVFALGTGATMVGATLLGASADLSDYPSPFVKDGKFNAILVVGDAAASSDVIGSVDVATSLQFASRTAKSVSASGATGVSAVGDSWKVGTSSKTLELSENLDAGASSTKQEEIRNITSFIGDDELDVLSKGTFRNDKGSYEFQQFIYFDETDAPGTRAPRTVVHTTTDNDVTDTFFYVPDGEQVGRYALEFTTSAESDVTDSAGTADTTGTYLWNFEGESLSLLGKDYSIVKARKTAAASSSGVELTLMGGAVRDILQLGETKTYTVGGNTYEVELAFVSSTQAKFIINGESTDSLAEGSTDTLADKTQVGVRDILYQDFAGGVQQAEFYLGADKIVLKDTNIADTDNSDLLKVGEETIDNVEVLITGTNDTSSYKLDTIQLNITADDDLYVASGEKVSEKLEENQGLLGAWDIEYAGLAASATEEIKISPSGSDDYNLQFVDASGNSVTLPLVNTASGANLKLGDSDNDLALHEGAVLDKKDYFIVSDFSQSLGDRRTYAFRYEGATITTSDTKTVKFKNLGTGENIERTWAHIDGASGSGDGNANIKVGGATYRIWNESAGNDFDIRVDMNGDASLLSKSGNTGVPLNITTNGGAVITFDSNGHLNASGNADVDFWNFTSADDAPSSAFWLTVNVQTLDADDYDNVAPSAIGFNITAASAEVGAAEDTVNANLNYITPEGEDNTQYAYTTLGTYVKWDNPTSDPDTITITYPTTQAAPQLFVTTPGVTLQEGSVGAEGDVTYYETTPIEVGAAKLASEVASVTAQNTILVGGPCANPAAAAALGNPADCTAGFEEGKAVVRYIEHANGNVALLVAGYSATDTRRAARVLANYEEWQEAGQLTGTEVEVSGTTLTDITVSAPAPAAVEEEAMVETETEDNETEETA